MGAGIGQMVTARRFDQFTVHQILQGFSQKDCLWLDSAKRANTRPSAAMYRQKQDLLAQLLTWIFDDLLVDIVRVRMSDGLYGRMTVHLLLCRPTST